MKKTWKTGVGIALAVVMVWGSLFPIPSYAGESQTRIENESFKEKIDNSLWNNPEGDVQSQNGHLIFPAESTADTRLITKNAAKFYEAVPVIFDAEYTIKLQALPEGNEFLFACGLARIESLSGEDGNVELAFQNQGGITAGLRTYVDGETTELAAPKRVGVSVGGTMTVSARLTAQKQYTVKVNGQTIYDGVLPVSGEGRLGFLQTGECRAEISNLKIILYSYDTPENPYVEEHFDDETFDCSKITTNMVYGTSYYPFDSGVQEYNGESVFMFENAGLSYLSTKYEYSNFELTFDVPYLQRKDEVDEAGEVIKPMSGWFAITYGDEAEEQVGHGFENSSDCILFDRYSVVRSLIRLNDSIVRANLINTEYDYFAADETRGFSVLVRMVDGHIDIGIKWMGEANFKIISSYDLDTHATPTGYIHIWACETANWAMDNLVIRNLDMGAKIIETEYKTAKVTVPADYAFQKEELVYREKEEKDNEALWYLLIPGAVVLAAAFIGIPALIQKKKAGKEKEGHET